MTRLVTTAVALAVLTMACGGSSPGGGGATTGPVGIDRNRQASTVTDAEKGELCDWFAPMVGGYAAIHPCAMASLTAPPDRPTCITDYPVCTGSVTFGQLEDCIVAIVAAEDACTSAAIAQTQTRPDCQAALAAGCFD